MPRPRAASREKILAATLEVFRVAGYEGTTMPAIAERCGVSPGTLYNYFRSKEDLIRACAREGGTPGLIFGRIRAEIGCRSVSDLLREAAEDLARFFDARLPGMLMRAAGAPRPGGPGSDTPRRAIERAREYFEAEIEAGRIRVADPEALAWGFVGGLFYHAMFEHLYGRPRTSRLDAERFAAAWARETALGLARAGGRP